MTSAANAAHRTVLLLGHSGTGKTTLGDALLRLRHREHRGGFLDHEPEERDRGHSLSLAAGTFDWDGQFITVLDAPGGPETSGDAFAALPAADVAVFVVDAEAGVQPQHDVLWAACEELDVPRVLFLNKLDAPRADYESVIDALRARYGKVLAPVHMPIGLGADFTGVVDLLHFKAVERIDGKRVVEEVPDALRDRASSYRDLLVEAIVENDDALLERYLEGEVPATEELAGVFAHGIARCGFFPVLCGSATTPIGVRWLAEFLLQEAPAPSADGPVTAYVCKTHSDPYVGRINLVRIASGTVDPTMQLVLARSGASVRLHHPFVPLGQEHEQVESAPAGSVIGCAKLDDVHTGDVLATAGTDPRIPTLPPPSPQHRTAVRPASKGDDDRMSVALGRLTEEDPALRVERDAETGQTVLWTYGHEHFVVCRERLARKFGVVLEEEPLRIAYRETLRGTGRGVGKHVKQSGGHGQFGIAEIEVSPQPRGEGFVFSDEIVGGAIPRQFIPSVEKGIVDAMRKGVMAGYPVVDVAVRLLDGKAHSVDSSDMAFQTAGSLAFRAAAEEAGLVLLEPVMRVVVTVPDDLVGDAMGDLSSRRGRIQGTEQVPGPTLDQGRSRITALVPQAELATYVPELRSLSSGTADVTIVHDHYDVAPDHVAANVPDGR